MLGKETIEEDNDEVEPPQQDMTTEYDYEPSSVRKFMLSGVKVKYNYVTLPVFLSTRVIVETITFF